MEVNSRSILYMIADRFGLPRSTTEERLKLQKIVYLLQAYGVQFGYGYTWYKHGPYSQDLVYDAYAVLNGEREKYAEGTEGWEFSENTQERLNKFESEFKEVLSDAEELELLASVHFLKKNYEEASFDEEKFIESFKKLKPRLFNGNSPSKDDILRALQRSNRICPN